LVEGFYLGGGELLFGRHFQVAILIADRAEEAGRGGISWDKRGTGVTAGFPASAMVKTEAAFDLVFGAVAGIAVLDEKGADFFLEVVEIRRRQKVCPG
jgi:hypothetical protein